MNCWLTVNRVCNLRCKWCYAAADGFQAADTMTIETLERIQEATRAKDISRFILLGGEPTLHLDLCTFIRKLKPHKVALVTNAIKLADKEYLRQLKECGLDVVTISLKGANDEQYKKNTGEACFAAVTRAVANLNELGIPYSISVTFSSSIMQALPSIIDWMMSANADVMSINYCRPIVLSDRVSVRGAPHPREMAAQTVASYESIKNSGVRCIYSFMLPLCLLPFGFIQELVERGLLTTVCQLQKESGLIFMPNGILIPCHHLFDYSFGKVGTDFNTTAELDEVQKTEKIRNFYRKARSLPDRRCQDCGLKMRCGGGCFIQYLHYNPADLIRQPFERSMP